MRQGNTVDSYVAAAVGSRLVTGTSSSVRMRSGVAMTEDFDAGRPINEVNRDQTGWIEEGDFGEGGQGSPFYPPGPPTAKLATQLEAVPEDR